MLRLDCTNLQGSSPTLHRRHRPRLIQHSRNQTNTLCDKPVLLLVQSFSTASLSVAPSLYRHLASSRSRPAIELLVFARIFPHTGSHVRPWATSAARSTSPTTTLTSPVARSAAAAVPPALPQPQGHKPRLHPSLRAWAGRHGHSAEVEAEEAAAAQARLPPPMPGREPQQQPR